jgi:integrase
MASASITARTTKSGRRFVVRYRLGGRAYPVEHGGSFPTMREARARRDLIAGEIAVGRNPRLVLDGLRQAPPAAKTFRVWAEEYRESRVDVAAETRRGIKVRTARLLPLIGDLDPARLTPSTVTGLIATLELKPSSMRRYVETLASVLDYAGVDPNPARDNRVRLPREEHTEIEPPSAATVARIVTHSLPRWRLALRTLAETGLRVGELHALEWRDVDEHGSRFRIRSGKTAAARRWVAVPEPLMAEIGGLIPPDDRTSERRVFPGATPPTIKNVMRRACQSAGLSLYSPHDLRHRYASVQIARGVPVTIVAAQIGHTRKSMTLDTYSHVLIDEDPERSPTWEASSPTIAAR